CSFRERGRAVRQDLLGVVVFVGCLFVAGVALAQDALTPSPTATSSPSPSPTRTPGPILPSARAEVDRQRKLDATFMTRTQLRGLEEIELGRIAERASNNAVRSLARELAQERGKAH